MLSNTFYQSCIQGVLFVHVSYPFRYTLNKINASVVLNVPDVLLKHIKIKVMVSFIYASYLMMIATSNKTVFVLHMDEIKKNNFIFHSL